MTVALLSIENFDASGHSGLLVCGEPVLAHQIAALRTIGVRKFLIEIDAVSGSLLLMADRLNKAGNSVEFVRSAHDLQSALSADDLLVVQSENIYISPALLTDLLDRPTAFIATLDGRTDNETFERMDLNTHWAGLAVVSASTFADIGTLPDGWSTTSSLLRQAMQDGLERRNVAQKHVQGGSLRRIYDSVDAAKLTKDIIRQRVSHEPGIIEYRLFAPIALAIASSSTNGTARATIVNVITLALASASVVSVWFAQPILAVSAAFLAMLLRMVGLALRNVQRDDRRSQAIEAAIWLLLSAALIVATGEDAIHPGDGMFAGFAIVGLGLLSRRLHLPIWAKQALQSPAMLLLAIATASVVSSILNTAQILAIGQLTLLTIAKWSDRTQFESSDYA